jgi:hypothetical protein
VVQAGTWITSVTLSKAVSLTGVSSATAILQALPGQRVLTVTGGLISNTVVISGLTFTGGAVTSTANCPASCGGGVLVTGTARPLLANVVISGNVAWQGGGLYAESSSPLDLHNASVINNRSLSAGGGLRLNGPSTLHGGALQGNACTQSACQGGGLYGASGLTLNGVHVSGNSSGGIGGGALAVGALRLTGSLFTGNQCTATNCQGGGAYAWSTLDITATHFVSNTARWRGGGAAVNFNTASLNGGLFQRNQCVQAGCLGGGLYANSALVLTGTEFLTNTSQLHGPGAYANGPATLNGGLFQRNDCQQDGCMGGGLYAGSTLAVTGTHFIINDSRWHGGAVQAAGNATVSGAFFDRNECSQDGCVGGGLAVSGTLSLAGTHFIGNESRWHGGAVYAHGAAAVAGSALGGNQCEEDGCRGGGLYANSTLALTATDFISNQALLAGGGVYAFGAATLSGGLFQGNVCTQTDCSGGGLLAVNPLTASGTHFVNNRSRSFGGGAYAGSAATLDGGLFQANQCSQGGCRGGGLWAGASLWLNNTSFLTNTSSLNGGGAYAGGQASLNGGVFRGNHCDPNGCSGGGLMTASSLALTGTHFIDNLAGGAGGVHAVGPASLNGGLFEANSCVGAECLGGGLVAGWLSLSGTEFISNVADFEGGGAFVFGTAALEGGTFHGNSCTANNSASCRAGGLYANGALAVTGTRFISNTAWAGNGGGAYAAGAAVLNGALFQGNQCMSAACRGGGLYAGGSLSVAASEFRHNAGGLGGAIMHAAGTGGITNTLFAANTAASGAALLLDAAGSFSLVHATIAAPTQVVTGAIRATDGSLYVTNTIFANYTIGLQRDGLANVQEDYNLFSGVLTPTAGGVSSPGNSLTGTAGFAGAAAGDYRLASGSAAIDAGANAGAASDFFGTPRPLGAGFDIGYHEFDPTQRLYLPLVVR